MSKEHWQGELADKFGLDATGPEDARRENAVVVMGYPEALRHAAIIFFGWGMLEWVTALLLLAMSSLSLMFGGITAESMYSVDNSQAGSASAWLGVAQYALSGGAGLV